MTAHSNPILDSIIEISEKTKGSKLSETVLTELEKPLTVLSDFLEVESTEALFFAIIFAIQHQESRNVNLHQIARYFDYPFLELLKYRYAIDELARKSLIELKERTNISSHPENNGYGILGSVSNSVMDGKKVFIPEKENVCLDSAIFEVINIMRGFKKQIMDSTEYKRQIINFENTVLNIDLFKNITAAYPNDFDSRILLYYVSSKIVDEDFFWKEEKEEGLFNMFNYLPIETRFRKRRSFSSGTDSLFQNKYIEENIVERDELNVISFSYRLTNTGIKKFFGKDLKEYLEQNNKHTEIDEIILAIKRMSLIYERESYIELKKNRLRMWEKDFKDYRYFKTLEL